MELIANADHRQNNTDRYICLVSTRWFADSVIKNAVNGLVKTLTRSETLQRQVCNVFKIIYLRFRQQNVYISLEIIFPRVLQICHTVLANRRKGLIAQKCKRKI